MDKLREGCPWDREQTFESLRNNTIEEVFELVDAIAANDMQEVKRELGDLLLHIVFYAKIGSEQGAFDIADVCDAISEKLIYRHPHVFGDISVEGAGEVSRNWEALKQREKERKGGVLSGVPRSMPPLVKAYRIQEKMAAVGFDWQHKEDVWAKVKEEIDEIETELRASKNAANSAATAEEFGDLLFALINAARLYGINPEAALENCNKKVIKRFEYIESEAAQQGVSVKDLTLDEMERFWQEAKN